MIDSQVGVAGRGFCPGATPAVEYDRAGGTGAASHERPLQEIRDIDNKELIHLVGKHKIETLAAADTVGRLMLQCALQPGLGHVMHTLLGFEGSEFYMCEQPRLVGQTFGSISLRFADAVPIGVKSAVRGGWHPLRQPRARLDL